MGQKNNTSIRKSKWLLMLISVLISIGLWFYVVTVQNPEDTANISRVQVTYAGVETMEDQLDLLITEGANATVDLKITGRRSELKKLSRDNITAEVDVTKITKSGSYELPYTITMPSDVNTASVSIADRTPRRISFTVEQIYSKTIPVRGVLDGSVADGYTTGEMTYDHDNITIRAPRDVLDTISYAQVIMSHANLTTSVSESLPYALVTEEGEIVDSSLVLSDVTAIHVTLPVMTYKEIPLTVEFIAGGAATETNAVYTVSPETVTISGEETVLQGINQIVLGNVDLAEVDGSAQYEFPILIPNDTANVSGEETAAVSVEIRGLDSTLMRVQTIEFSNVPDGYDAESLTQLLQVTVRDTAEELGQIRPNNLRAVADLSECAQSGTYTVPVTVHVDGYPNAGIVGSYTIVVALT